MQKCLKCFQMNQKYHDEEKTEWEAARTKCLEQDSDLAIIDNPNENLFVYDFAKENSIDLWIGILENVSIYYFF